MNINIEDLQLKFTFLDKAGVIATLDIYIGQFEIRNFIIRKTQFKDSVKKFYLTPPSKTISNNKYFHYFRVEPAEEWKKFEKMILEKFDKQHTDWLIKEEKIQ